MNGEQDVSGGPLRRLLVPDPLASLKTLRGSSLSLSSSQENRLFGE